MLFHMIFLALIGLLIGYISSRLMYVGDMGVWKSMILGVIGMVLGGFVAGLVGITASGIIGRIVVGVAGACLLLYLVGRMQG